MGDVFTLPADRAAISIEQACDQVQQRRFTDPRSSLNDEDFPGINRMIKTEMRAIGVLIGQVADLKHGFGLSSQRAYLKCGPASAMTTSGQAG